MAAICAPLVGFIFLNYRPSSHNAAPFIEALLWGLLIFEALIGFGQLGLRLLSKQRNFPILAPAIGLLFVLLLCGWLNLFALLTPLVMSVTIIFGALVFCLFAAINLHSLAHALREIIRRSTVLSIFLLFLSLAAVTWAYFCATSNQAFNFHDDYHAYLFFPEKLLQAGSLGADPFSERRLISGLAGNSVLLAFGLTQMKWYFLHSIDLGLGILLFAYSIYASPFPKFIQHSVLIKSCLVIGVSLMPIPVANITSSFLPMTFIFSLWVLFAGVVQEGSQSSRIGFKGGIAIGILIASLLTLKSTLTPYAAISFLFISLYLGITGLSWRALLKFFLGSLLGASVMLAPWMVDLFQSSGTFFYPLLGKGFHATQYGYFLSATNHFFSFDRFYVGLLAAFTPLGKSIFIITLLFMITLVYQGFQSKEYSRQYILAVIPLVASLANCLIVGYALGGYGAYRYVYFVALSSLIASIVLSSPLMKRDVVAVAIFCICAFFLIRSLQHQVTSFSGRTQLLLSSWSDNQPISLAEQKRYAEVSAAIPCCGGKVLLRVAYPFLLRLDANTLLADYPGAASPPPGMPIGKGPDALKAYLISQGVQYVVWDYQLQANFSKKDYGDRLSPSTHPWIGSEARLAFDFQDNIELLRLRGMNVFDKNGIAIIDLR